MKYKNTLFGLLLVGIITIISSMLANTSLALTLAILIGILIGNTFFSKIESYTNQGVILAKGTLLRAGIVLYGFKITLTDINSVCEQGLCYMALKLP